FRIFVKLYLDLFRETLIVLLKDFENLGTAELRCNLFSVRKHLSQFCTAQEHPVVFAVRTGLHGGHAVAFLAVECPVYLEVLCFKVVVRDLVENLLRLEWPIVFAHTRMVPADDHIVAAVVLPEGGMQQSFTRSSISHVKRIARLDTGIFDKIKFHELVYGLYSYICRNIAGFELAEELMDQDTITDLNRNLGKKLMRAVHRVP